MARFRNFYRCPCGEEWNDVYDCQCDDRCPSCNTAVSLCDSEDYDEWADRDNELAQFVQERLAANDADKDYVGTKDSYNRSEAAVALMLWEAYLDMDYRGVRPPDLAELADDYGVGTTREFMLPLAVLAEKMWLYACDLPGYPLDDYSFDWEICPAVIAVIDWYKVDLKPERLPTKEALYASVLEYLTSDLANQKPAARKGRQLNLS